MMADDKRQGRTDEDAPSKDRHAFIAALDFGGTKLAFGLVDRAGNVLHRTIEMREGRTPKDVAAWAAQMLDRHLPQKEIAISDLAGIGSTVPGYVDARRRVIVHAAAHDWHDVPFSQMLEEATGLRATIENDINACAVAERQFCRAEFDEDLLWITVSTGIGGALLLRGQVFVGQGAAGEIGHFVIEENGPLCGCGHRGCLEALAGGRALGRLAQEKSLGVSTAKELFDLAASGNAQAEALIAQATTDIARAVAYSVNLLDIPLIVFGGAIGLALDLKSIRTQVGQRILRPPEQTPRIERSGLGYNAALLGAAAIGFEEKEMHG